MTKRRVVITGLGVLSPVGNDADTAWENITNGKSGIRNITSFDASDYGSQVAGEVDGFDPLTVVDKKALKRYDRYSLFALAAAKQACEQAGLDDAGYAPERKGCILGVGIGGLQTFEDNHRALIESGPRKVSPFLIPAMISNLGPGNVGIAHGLRGVNYTVTSACTSGTHAVGEAYRMIADGLQDAVVTGGCEAAITPVAVAGFGRMKALSTRNDDPQRASRPFDKDRDGFVIGEGAGVMVLEEYESAKKRGADIIAEVVGYGFSCDAYHITAPAAGGEGALQCMGDAIKRAGIPKEQITYVNAHGTSTPINDPAESQAIRKIFGDHADKGLMVSSTKSMTGHLLGAAGGVEAVFAAKVVQTGVVPPTINLDNPDEGCDLDYVPHTAREASVEAAMSNSFGFGGTNASVIVKRV
jgi:3-oxoacyl-[acyl-carrier-protein] synthase II